MREWTDEPDFDMIHGWVKIDNLPEFKEIAE